MYYRAESGRDHTHFIKGSVSYEDGHDHEYESYLSEAIIEGTSHMHFFRGDTTESEGHSHRYCGYTGPAVFMPGGMHYHMYGARTSYDDRHYHTYKAMTSRDMETMEV
jgi:hypothetical protein